MPPNLFKRLGIGRVSLLLHTAFIYYEVNNAHRVYSDFLTVLSILPSFPKRDDKPHTPPKPANDDDEKK